VLTGGPKVPVDVNGGSAPGSSGLNTVEESELLEARWVQLAGA
jgi:hypothetical protein